MGNNINIQLADYPENIRKLFAGPGKRNQKVKPLTWFRTMHKEQAAIAVDRATYAPDDHDDEPRSLTMEEASFMLLGYRNPRAFSD